MFVAEVRTLMDVPAYSMQQVAEICTVLLMKMNQRGYNALPVDEQVELRLLRTLLDGFA